MLVRVFHRVQAAVQTGGVEALSPAERAFIIAAHETHKAIQEQSEFFYFMK